GVTATALLVSVLRRLGGRTTWFLPNRFEDGYGLGAAPLERCCAEQAPDLVVTVDCGTCACEAVAAARRRGVEVVVTDHHEATGEPAPAAAVVNPRLGDDPRAGVLAGVGVAFKLCHALVKRGLDTGAPDAGHLDLRDFLDLVALGTVADVVPLTGENRVLVRAGLECLSRMASPGLRALCAVGRVQPPIRAAHVGFVLGPRLNAVGRLSEAGRGLELLLTDDAARAEALALELDAANTERRRIEAETVNAAMARVEPHFDPERDMGLAVGGDGWHVGTVGLAASRLVSRFYRPCAVVSFDGTEEGRGSCRSIAEVDVVAALEACGDTLIRFGGHRMAAGFRLRRDRFDAFRERFNAACGALLGHRPVRPRVRFDGWVGLGELDAALLGAVERMRPFGAGNPEPVWGVRGVHVIGKPRRVGKNHLKLRFGSGSSALDAIGFGLAERAVPDGPLDVLGRLRADTYRGAGRVQLQVTDFRACRAAGEEVG
ncbi:MAG: single-stranded-DNA-specific exonuclease RecJ, partial [Lentisphaerae bacterium]|nr:single-stranded-DNA-specific exonuclease RecJ [Lentisphaerota bacterium]